MEQALNEALDFAKNRHWPQVFQLVDQCPSILNSRPPQRQYAIVHHAAFWGDAKVVTALLARGADRGVLAKDGKTPADIAIERGHAEVVQILRGSVPEAVQNKCLDLAKNLKWTELWDQLSLYPDAINCRPPYRGYGILHQAAFAGDLKAVQRLLVLGADRFLLSKDGETAAQVALQRRHEEVVALLETGSNASSPAAAKLETVGHALLQKALSGELLGGSLSLNDFYAELSAIKFVIDHAKYAYWNINNDQPGQKYITSTGVHVTFDPDISALYLSGPGTTVIGFTMTHVENTLNEVYQKLKPNTGSVKRVYIGQRHGSLAEAAIEFQECYAQSVQL